MTSRDACTCLRSLRRSRDSLPFASLRISPNRPAQVTNKIDVRHQSTQAADSDYAKQSYELSQTPTFERKPRTKKDGFFKLSAGVILCRSPIVTRELTEFEVAFYAYQRHLKSRLSSPFPTDFYFTKGSLASKRWLAGEDARQQANSLTPSTVASSTDGEITGQERELQDQEDVATSVAMSRITDADRKNDTKSLDRKLDRTLYLLLKKSRSEHSWQFPQGAVGANEALHESRSRILTTLAGKDMNTWAVGRVPVGVTSYDFKSQELGYKGNKTYYMRERIFAGQCQLQEGTGIVDFGWFTKEEVEERVSPELWRATNTMLPSQ